MEILNRVKRLGVKISLQKGNIDIKAPKGVLNQELIDEIKINKYKIISHLSKNEKISKVTDLESYPLTSSQERFWILSQQNKISSAYNIPLCVTFIGNLDVLKLNESINFLINRYEIFRSRFVLDSSDRPIQLIKDFNEINFSIKYKDYSNTNMDSEEEIEKVLHHDILEVFDLSEAPLLRCTLVKKSEFEHVFLVVFHHIISDGWSIQIFINELSLIYNTLLKNEKPELPELRIQYKDYAVWKDFYKENNNKVYQNYWLDKMSGEIPALSMFSNKRPKIKTYNGDSFSCSFNDEIKTLIGKFSKNYEVSAFMIFTTVLKILLSKYSGQDDIIIGTPISGRDNSDLENQIGLFLNTLALRSQIDKNQTFEETLLNEKITLLEAYENQDYPFEELVEKLNLARDTSRSSLFDVLIVYNSLITKQKADSSNASDKNTALKIQPYDLDTKKTKFDLIFTFIENDFFSLNIRYNTDVFEKIFVEQLLSHFQTLLFKCLTNPNEKIKQLSLLSNEEENQLLYESNFKKVDYPKDKTIFKLFEEQCLLNGTGTALVSSSKTITYELLSERVDCISKFLKVKGVQKGDRVIICYEQGILEAITAMLAIWKIGAVYVPIEYDIAEDRLRFIIEDTNSKILLSQGKEMTNFGKLPIEIINTDVIENDAQTDLLNLSSDYSIETHTKKPFSSDEMKKWVPDNQKSNIFSEENDAYIIYTSGSTGTPKGVLVSHKNILDYLYGLNSEILIDRFDSFAMMSTISTDLGNTVLYSSLAFGKTLHLFNKVELRDQEYIQYYFKNNVIDCIKIVPSYWNALSIEKEIISPSRMIIFGGEELDIITTKKIFSERRDDFEIVNHYGPTETTVGKLLHRVDKNYEYNKIPLGNVFSNSHAIIVDDELNICPYGIEGELLIGGDGVSKGYINNDIMNDQKFIDDKFFKTSNKWYKTGDRVVRRFNNDIEFLGRKDNQVKIMGHRIELNEIDSVLKLFPSINATVTVVTESESGNKKLHTFYVSDNNCDIDIFELNNFAKTKLPFYSIPLSYQKIDLIPFSSNGKINYKVLFEKIEKNISSINSFMAPRNETESKLCSIWSEVLGVEQIGITDNFFEIGGNSIKAITLKRKMDKELNINITLESIYNCPTISAILSNSDATSIVYYNEQNHSDTIYFIPPILGSPVLFSPFSKKVNTDFNCIGFRYQGLEKGEIFYKSILEIAEDFYAKILQHDNNGKIVLFTYSMGSLVGFEVLKMLEEKFNDKEISLLILDKSLISNQLKNENEDYLRNIDNEINKYLTWAKINEKEEQDHFKKFIFNNVKISNEYLPAGQVKSDVYVFESNNLQKYDMESWKIFSKGQVKIKQIKGEHWDAMDSKNWDYYSEVIYKNKN